MNKCIIDFYYDHDLEKAVDIALKTFNVSPLNITVKQRLAVKYNDRLIITFNSAYETEAFINYITNNRIHLSAIKIRKKRYLKKIQGIPRKIN